MKTITLFRHAKSSWKYAIADVHRPLNGRGLRQGMAQAKRCTLTTPDMAFTSHANRAVCTAMFYVEEGRLQPSALQIVPALYEASSEALLVWLRALDDTYQNIWLFGHNPGFNDLITLLTGTECPNLVTSGYARMQSQNKSWGALGAGSCNLVEFNQRY